MSDIQVLEIQRLTPDQWPVWRTVRHRALEEAPYAFGSILADWSGDGDTEARWRARLETVPANFIAYIGGSAVGQSSGVETERANCVELLSLWVAPEARGTGVGRGLIDAVRQWGRQEQAQTLILHVKTDNSAAISLYEREGFERSSAPVERGEYEMVEQLGR
ncbi:MAG: GNAT family N-acetyltransferase [Acidimicrobiales bacterium]